MRSLFNRRLERAAAFRLAYGVAFALLAIDQITKNLARDNFAGSPQQIIGDWLRFTYHKNPGAAFSSFTGSGRLIGLIGIGVVIFLVYLIAKSNRWVETFAFGLVLGGALGNLTDRIFREEGFLDGSVVDWIDWWFIPTFNIADAALNVGVGVLLIAAIFFGSPDE